LEKRSKCERNRRRGRERKEEEKDDIGQGEVEIGKGMDAILVYLGLIIESGNCAVQNGVLPFRKGCTKEIHKVISLGRDWLVPNCASWSRDRRFRGMRERAGKDPRKMHESGMKV
jgi:hypothetical protein